MMLVLFVAPALLLDRTVRGLLMEQVNRQRTRFG
jgi:hypothetical protein